MSSDYLNPTPSTIMLWANSDYAWVYYCAGFFDDVLDTTYE